MSNNRVLVVGLDGATFDIINPLVAQGKLTNLQGLIKKGTSGLLESTLPPVSALAWPSFYTGKNPGKHGIYGFVRLKPGTYDIEPVNASHRYSEPIWSYLTTGGKKGIIINVPITYPADAINGFFISGMDAPILNEYSVYPSGLKNKIKKEIGDYTIECDLIKSLTYKTGKKVLDELRKAEDMRIETAKYFMRKIDWDYLIIVLVASDRVQHFFWHCMDPAHPRFNERGAKAYRTAVENTYRYLDKYLGELLSLADDDDTVLVLSDHGMKPFDRILPLIDMNEILSILGYLRFNRIRRGAMANLMLNGWRIGKSILPLKFMQYVRRKFPDLRNSLYLSKVIDWNNTKAFAPYFDEVTAGGICINVKGREPNGIVEVGEDYEEIRNDLISKLEDLKHPITGKKIVQKVYRREEIYSGDHVNDSPDLVIKWHEENIFSGQDIGEGHWNGFEKRRRKKLDLGEHTGEHAQNGIFIAKGKNINKGVVIEDASIKDIAPTLLFLNKQPVPADMDGKVLEEIFDEKFLSENPVEYADPKIANKSMQNFQYSEHDKKVIEKRLKDLGYL